MKAVFPLLLLLALAGAAGPQRRSLGVFSQWGAFQEDERCFAIAEPEGAASSGRGAFASVAYWPGRRVGGQVYFRLSREKRSGSAVLLRIDDAMFQLAAGGADAWAPDPRADAEIASAMRRGIVMTVETRSTRGSRIRDQYRLRGAATAIDAAAIACAAR